ncbi:MAG TPA: hypothetical protein VFV37_09935 [Luteibaculaceae bacterium]|nr:hypothetical protein [Luteibaculaceae bacterium]
MKRKLILRLLLATLAIVIVLFTVLVVHIWPKIGPTDQGHLNWQLARVDFISEIQGADMDLLKQVVGQVPGVTRVHVDTTHNTLVYAYQPGAVNQQMVAERINQKTTLKARPFVLDKAALETGCPAINRNGFSGKLVDIIRSIKY